MTIRLTTPGALVLSFLVAACSAESPAPLVASDVELSAARAGVPMRAAYLRLRNNTGKPVRITSASSPSFERVELHETIFDNDVARMRPVTSVVIEANAEISFERGGMHLMLMRPVGDAASAERVRLDLFDGERLLISVTAMQEPR